MQTKPIQSTFKFETQRHSSNISTAGPRSTQPSSLFSNKRGSNQEESNKNTPNIHRRAETAMQYSDNIMFRDDSNNQAFSQPLDLQEVRQRRTGVTSPNLFSEPEFADSRNNKNINPQGTSTLEQINEILEVMVEENIEIKKEDESADSVQMVQAKDLNVIEQKRVAMAILKEEMKFMIKENIQDSSSESDSVSERHSKTQSEKEDSLEQSCSDRSQQALKFSDIVKQANPVNKLSMKQTIQDNVKSMIMSKMMQNFEEGTVRDQFHKDNLEHDHDNTCGQDTKFLIEKKTFQQHLDVEQVLSIHCNLSVCYKMRDKRFVIKSISTKTIELQEFMDKSENVNDRFQNEFQGHQIKFMDSWINIPPQLPFQNFVKCYGLIKINDNFYSVSDCVEDNKLGIAQKNEYSFFKKQTGKYDNFKYGADQMLLPEEELEVIIEENEENTFKKDSSFHFFGERLYKKQVKVACNVYQTIKSFNLQSLGSYPKIPEFYIRYLLGFIIQISRTFAHAHRHGLVHGAFDLSKVLVQKVEIDEQRLNQMYATKHSKLEKKQTVLFEQRNENYNFFMTNFEPFQVFKIMKNVQEKEMYAKLFKVKGIDLSQELATQIIKIKDLHAFANAIIEILLAKTHEFKESNESDLKGKAIHGGYSLDMIPMIWSKTPEINSIMRVIAICFSNQITSADTVKMFDIIYDIASTTYKSMFGSAVGNQDVRNSDICGNQISFPKDYQMRLQSHVLNDQAVIWFLNITDFSTENDRLQAARNILNNLERAISMSTQNSSALLNLILLKWHQGLIRDDEVIQLIQTKLYQIDRELALVFFILFKKHVQGESIQNKYFIQVVDHITKDSTLCSHIAMKLFDNIDFIQFKNQQNNSYNKKRLKFQKQLELDENVPKKNQIYKIHNNEFEVKDFFFSNNDLYIVVICKNEALVIDSRTGECINIQTLPNYETFKNQWLNKLQNPMTQKTEDDIEETLLQTLGLQNMFMNSSEMSPILSGTPSPQNFTEGANKPNLAVRRANKNPRASMRENTQNQEIIDEMMQIFDQFPPQWTADISNNGKILALYDLQQPLRNKIAKFSENKQEMLLIYTLSKQNNLSSLNPLDMLELLNDQEVMHFGLDDFIKDKFSLICVQAKDLQLYVIDFLKKQLLFKVDQFLYTFIGKSVFYDPLKRGKNMKYFQEIKDFAQLQKELGNEVHLPKINDRVIIIKQKDSQLIKVYNIRKKLFTRQFILTKQETQWRQAFEIDLKDHQDHAMSSSDDSPQHSRSLSPQPDEENSQIEIPTDESKVHINQIKLQKVKSKKDQTEKLKLMRLSPLANYIVCLIDNCIFIKILNVTNNEQWNSNLSYHKSIIFMPLYLDEDYNFHVNKNKILSEEQSEENLSILLGKQQIYPRLIDITIQNYAIVNTDAPLIQSMKNDVLLHLCNFLNKLMPNPQQLFALQMRPRTRMKKLAICFEIMRNYQQLDPAKKFVSRKSFRGIRNYLNFDLVNFKRSYDYCSNFTCTTKPDRFLIAMQVNRAVHVYNYIMQKLSFVIKISSVVTVSLSEPFKNTMFFLDSDNILVVQDSEYRIQLISLATLNQNFSKVQVKKENMSKVQTLPLPEIATLKGWPDGNHIDPGFGIDEDGCFIQYEVDQNQQGDEDSSENEEIMVTGMSYINYESPISNVFYSRAESTLGMLAVVSQNEMKFTIYYVYEEENPQCDILWEIKYKFDNTFNQFGKHSVIDFDLSGHQFISATNMGFVCTWCIKNQIIEKACKVVHPLTGKVIILSKIISYNGMKQVIGYSLQSQALVIVDLKPNHDEHQDAHNHDNTLVNQNLKQQIKVSQPKVHLLEFDFQKKGNIIYLKTDPINNFLIVCFQDGSISVYDLKTLAHVKNSKGTGGWDQKVFVDDHCTFISRLSNSKKDVLFESFDWEYSCKNLQVKQNIEITKLLKDNMIDRIQEENLPQRQSTFNVGSSGVLRRSKTSFKGGSDRKLEVFLNTDNKNALQNFDVQLEHQPQTTKNSKACTIF